MGNSCRIYPGSNGVMASSTTINKISVDPCAKYSRGFALFVGRIFSANSAALRETRVACGASISISITSTQLSTINYQLLTIN